GDQPNDRAAQKDEPGNFLVPREGFGEMRANNRSGNGGEKRAEFDDAIAPRELLFRQKLRQKAVFGGAEQSALGAGQEERNQRQLQIVNRKAGDRENHHRDFEDFGGNGDVALAVAVGEISASHRKQKERQREQDADEQDLQFLFLGSEVFPDDQEDDEEFEGVVVEGALKLRGDQAPEAKSPGAGSVVHPEINLRGMRNAKHISMNDGRKE